MRFLGVVHFWGADNGGAGVREFTEVRSGMEIRLNIQCWSDRKELCSILASAGYSVRVEDELVNFRIKYWVVVKVPDEERSITITNSLEI